MKIYDLPVMCGREKSFYGKAKVIEEENGVSRGIYGMNGGLIWDKVTEEYGVILARSSNLFRLF